VNALLEAFVSGTGGMGGFWEIVVKILLSAILGGAVGAEREHTGKWAGLRTHMSIAVGAALLADVSIKIGHEYGSVQGWDPGRIAAQIVSGLGFIGAGSIIQSRGAVHGLTTAAGLWVAGAIGLAVGAGFYDEALVTTVALLVILVVFRPVARRLAGGRLQSLAIQISEHDRLPDLVRVIEETGVKLEQVDVDEAHPKAGGRAVLVRFAGTPEDRKRVATALDRLPWAEPEGGD
jgi:putative Mg2+ transporter-C (MgtC) family protein